MRQATATRKRQNAVWDALGQVLLRWRQLLWQLMGTTFVSQTDLLFAPVFVAIDVIDEGKGPLMVLLPSAGRDSEDHDKVAEGLATAGFRVLRPQPRGAGKSTGPTEGITLHDLAKDVALTIENAQDGQAIIVGHAFGNWVARMTAADHPELVRGVVIAAGASKDYPKDLLVSLRDAANVALPDQQRLAALRIAFFAPGNDPSIWLKGWHPKIAAYQRPIIASPKEQE
jgi:pimeloyl-ACP methyl ester carboxylesterase